MKIPYFNPELARSVVEPNPDSLIELYALLSSDELVGLAVAGEITVGMIRPGLNGAVRAEGHDIELADVVEREIAHLGFAAKFSIQFDEVAADDFYTGKPKEIQLGQPPLKYDQFEHRWGEFMDLMTRPSATVLLLHERGGNAIPTWRQQVGHYDIEKNRDPLTIRGKLGIDNYNNLVHGSDSPQSAVREIGIIRDLVSRRIEQASNQQ